MGYIGRGLDKIANVEKLDNITFNGGTTYALTKSSSAFTPNSANSLLVSIDGVIQQGNFSVSTTNIVFDFSPTSNNTCNFIMHYGVGVINIPADDTITSAKIVDNAIDSEHYTDGSIDTIHIGATQVTGAKLNNDVISAQTELAVAPADTDELMVSDGGVLKRIDYSLIKSTAVTRPNVNPLIINGDMAVSQRGTSTASITSDGFHTLDRFETHISSLGTWTQSQDTDVPSGQGFANSLKMDCTTADASPSAGDFCIIRTKFEGQDLQLIKKGTANAEKLTLAFWVKSSKTGTHIVELFDVDNSRTVSQSYTISSADTWEKKVVNLPADTTGAFGDDNGRSLDIQFWLGTGTTYSSGTLQTTWGGQSNTDRAVGQVNLADNTSNNWYITGIQLEVGEFTSSTLPDFQHESYGDSLIRCQRYYQKYMTSAQSYVNASQNIGVDARYTTDMRATGTTMTWTLDASGNLTGSAPTVYKQRLSGSFGYQSATAAGNWYYYYDVTADAEL